MAMASSFSPSHTHHHHNHHNKNLTLSSHISHYPSLKLTSSSQPITKFSIKCSSSSSSSNSSKNEGGATPTAARKVGVSVYKPKSYEVLVTDAANSLAAALDDGKTRLEIDFPPLPTSISSYKGSSDEFSDANVQLALAVVRKLQENRETRACIVFPDNPEKRRASELFKSAIDLIDGITIGSLDDIPTGPVGSFFRSIRNTLDFDFDDENEERWKSDKPPTIFVFISCSTRELATIETYLAHGFVFVASCEDFPAGHPSQYYSQMSTLNCQFLRTPPAVDHKTRCVIVRRMLSYEPSISPGHSRCGICLGCYNHNPDQTLIIL